MKWKLGLKGSLVLGLYWDNGNENGDYYNMIGYIYILQGVYTIMFSA